MYHKCKVKDANAKNAVSDNHYKINISCCDQHANNDTNLKAKQNS